MMQRDRRAPRRGRLNYDLLACALSGHVLIGDEAAQLRPGDALVAREIAGVRWHRCLRCHCWLTLPAPAHPRSEHPPARAEIELPLRGRALRDRIVLRVIALDRALHFLILAVLAVALFAIAAHRSTLHHEFYRLLTDIQRGIGGPIQANRIPILGSIGRVLSLRTARLEELGGVFAGYALLEGVEAVGLWLQRRWAEYLTFLATTLLLPLEIYEIVDRVSWFKVLALIVNLAIVIYLLYAKRLFGLRGGIRREREERAHELSWAALEREAPEALSAPVADSVRVGR